MTTTLDTLIKIAKTIGQHRQNPAASFQCECGEEFDLRLPDDPQWEIHVAEQIGEVLP